MCGILGLYRPTGLLTHVAAFDRALDRLRRRGPDDAGVWNDAFVRFGHRRLAVLDLSPAGHQPMLSADGRYVIVFNGEIYNHLELRKRLTPIDEWRSTSDTETLLEAYREWGVDCLARLNGMFAFAIWDRHERKLFIARDRMGVKPLYYAWQNGQLGFSSRPGALAELLDISSNDFDPQALRSYLELGYVPAPLSFFRGVKKLLPGHYLLVDNQGPQAIRYWDFRHIEPDASLRNRPEASLADELDELLCRTVRDRLISDVPLGAFLSGGTDSALVVAAMKMSGVTNPRTFTIGFSDAAYDEGPAAQRIARYIGMDHVSEVLNPNDLLELLPTFIDEFDEPLADSSAFPTMAVARLARRHVTVALSGDGSDELFGGYHYYGLTERLAPTMTWPAALKRRIGAALAKLPSHRTRMLAGALDAESPVELFQYMRSFGKGFAPLLDDETLRSTRGATDLLGQYAASFALDLTPAETGMRLDAGLLLPDSYLQKVDVATMAYSLEARCPFTDYRLVEWAMRLPVEHKLGGGQTKRLLKQVLCRYLPRELVYQPKRGFSVPMARWLRGPLNAWAWDLFRNDALMSRLPIVKQRVHDMFRAHESGSRDAHPLLWAVLVLLCFMARQERRDTLSASEQPRAA